MDSNQAIGHFRIDGGRWEGAVGLAEVMLVAEVVAPDQPVRLGCLPGQPGCWFAIAGDRPS